VLTGQLAHSNAQVRPDLREFVGDLPLGVGCQRIKFWLARGGFQADLGNWGIVGELAFQWHSADSSGSVYLPCTSDRELWEFCAFWDIVESISCELSKRGKGPKPTLSAIWFGPAF